MRFSRSFCNFFDHCGTVAVSWFARREAGCQSNVCQLAGFDSLRPMLSVSDVWYRYPYNEIYWCPHYLLTLLTEEFFSVLLWDGLLDTLWYYLDYFHHKAVKSDRIIQMLFVGLFMKWRISLIWLLGSWFWFDTQISCISLTFYSSTALCQAFCIEVRPEPLWH